MDIRKRNLRSTNGNFQNVKLMIFREFVFLEETGEEKRRERNRYPGIRTQGEAAAGTKQARNEGRELGAREGVREGHGRGGGGREGRRRKSGGEECLQERHW